MEEYAKIKEEPTNLGSSLEESYLAQLAELRDQTVQGFGQMMKFGLKGIEGKLKAFQILQRFQAEISNICLKYLDLSLQIEPEEAKQSQAEGNQAGTHPNPEKEPAEQIEQADEPKEQTPAQSEQNTNQGPEEEPNQIILTLKTVKKHRTFLDHVAKSLEDPDHAERNHFAMKDSTSYMIGGLSKTNKRAVIFENGAQLKPAKIPIYRKLKAITFIPPLNCYLMNIEGAIVRKDLNSGQPYPFNTAFTTAVHGPLIYSDVLNRLVVCQAGKSIAVINVEAKEIEIEAHKTIGGNIVHFELVGVDHQKVVALTSNGLMLLYQLDFEKKIGYLMNYTKVLLEGDERLLAHGLAVCDRGEYVFTQVIPRLFLKSPVETTRMTIFKVEGNVLVRKASVEYKTQKNMRLSCSKCCGYRGSHIFWLGLTMGAGGVTLLYDYDVEAERLKEVEGRLSHGELNPMEIHRIENDFYYVGKYGKLMRLNIGF